MGAPYVTTLRLDGNIADEEAYFAALPAVLALQKRERLTLSAPVTFFVGENGTGKSTLLEAIAVCCGFNPEGGTANFNFASRESHSGLWQHLRVGRTATRPKDGFFLRAESFYNVATEIERLDEENASSLSPLPPLVDFYGGVSMHDQSHGESFMALVLNRFGGKGLYILDEPEAALSPTRQLALLAAIHSLVGRDSQFIISTHSPILMAYPGAEIYELSEADIRPTPYRDTEHFIVTKRFLDAPEHTLQYLLEEE